VARVTARGVRTGKIRSTKHFLDPGAVIAVKRVPVSSRMTVLREAGKDLVEESRLTPLEQALHQARIVVS